MDWTSLKAGGRFDSGEIAFVKFRESTADRRRRQCAQMPVTQVRVVLVIPSGARVGPYAAWKLRKPGLVRGASASVSNGSLRLVRTAEVGKRRLACVPAQAMRTLNLMGFLMKRRARAKPLAVTGWRRVEVDTPDGRFEM